MITDPSEYLGITSGFKLFDIFGSKRIQEALDAFDNIRFEKKVAIEQSRKTINSQNAMIRKLKNENDILKQTNDQKDAEIERLTIELEKQKKRITLSESAKTSSSNALERISEENTKLKVQLNELSRSYNELADMHDRLCELVRNGETDISLDRLYNKQAG